MLSAAASFDFRQHFVDDGMFRKRLPKRRIKALLRSVAGGLHTFVTGANLSYPCAPRVTALEFLHLSTFTPFY